MRVQAHAVRRAASRGCTVVVMDTTRRWLLAGRLREIRGRMVVGPVSQGPRIEMIFGGGGWGRHLADVEQCALEGRKGGQSLSGDHDSASAGKGE